MLLVVGCICTGCNVPVMLNAPHTSQAFVTPETLTGAEAWHCPKCKRSTESRKEMSIYRCPNALVGGGCVSLCELGTTVRLSASTRPLSPAPRPPPPAPRPPPLSQHVLLQGGAVALFALFPPLR